MDNFRDFKAGPDPFGRMWHAQFKFLQTAISIRHSNSVDVGYILDPGPGANGEERIQRTVVIPIADIRAYGARTGRPINDSWCARLAMCKIRNMIETAEDFDKDYVTVTPREMEAFDSAIGKWENEWIKKDAA